MSSSSVAAGGLVPARPDQHYEPPPGGQAIPGPRNVVRAREVIISGPAGAGLFVYLPKPGRGNLVASIQASGTTDPFGNGTVPGGYVQYANVSGTFYAWVYEAGINLYSASAVTGPYNLLGNVAIGPPPMNSTVPWTFNGNGNGTAIDATSPSNFPAIFAHSQSGQPALHVNNTHAAPANPIAWIEGAAAGDSAFRLNVTGDTNARLICDDTGLFKWGTGAAAPDTLLYRGGAAQLAASSIAANKSGVPEVWNLPTFANSWTNAATGAPLQYRLVSAPYNSAQFVGRLLVPAGVVAGQAIISALGGAYQPAHAQDIGAVDVTTGAKVRLQIGTGGVLLYESGAAAGDTIGIDAGLYSLDA